MGFFPINPLISRTVWAYAVLDVLDKSISDAALFFSGVPAYRTFYTTFSHLFIFFGYGSFMHKHPLFFCCVPMTMINAINQ